MDFGFFSKKSIAKMLNVPSDKFDTVILFINKLKDDKFNKDKAKKIVDIVKDYNVEQLNKLIDVIYDVVK